MPDIGSLGVVSDLLKPANGPDPIILETGSDSEIAEKLAQRLRAEFCDVTQCEGDFYIWSSTHWRLFSVEQLVARVRAFDGALYPTARGYGKVRLNRSRIESAIFILSSALADPAFFTHAPVGVNCLNGFITFNQDGTTLLVPHEPAQRQRHVLPGSWSGGSGALPAESLLARLLSGCFREDPDAIEKSELLAEIAGAAALGIGAQLVEPKAVILYGPSAANGKSQVLNLLRALLPESAVASISPRKMADDRFSVHLAGKLLNASDEIGDKAVFAEAFKAVVTGDWISGRDVYRSMVKFRPRALNVLSCNQFPLFEVGMDAGVRRRLLVIPFNRTIPLPERIEGIGNQIGAEEADLLLAWAVAGASRLIARGAFADLPSGRQAITNWIALTDPVGGWLRDRDVVEITGDPTHVVPAKIGYRSFRAWAVAEGIPTVKIPIQGQFTQRVASAAIRGLDFRRRARTNVFVGMRVNRIDPSDG